MHLQKCLTFGVHFKMRHGLYFKSPYHLSDIFMTNQRYSFDINVGLW